jgi:hypothetical protein
MKIYSTGRIVETKGTESFKALFVCLFLFVSLGLCVAFKVVCPAAAAEHEWQMFSCSYEVTRIVTALCFNSNNISMFHRTISVICCEDGTPGLATDCSGFCAS